MTEFVDILFCPVCGKYFPTGIALDGRENICSNCGSKVYLTEESGKFVVRFV